MKHKYNMRLAAAALFLCTGTAALAGELAVAVTDRQGTPVEHAVVYALPADGAATAQKSRPVVVDQVNKEFVRSITVIQTGTAISFPNSDNIRHHVYSLSAAKTFELPLYIGTPARPVLFDTPGAVVLGCNIHDWMIAYVYVVDTPWFAMTDAAGAARISGIPPGDYRLMVWHHRLKGEPADAAESIQMGEGTLNRKREVVLKPAFAARRAPIPHAGSYR